MILRDSGKRKMKKCGVGGGLKVRQSRQIGSERNKSDGNKTKDRVGGGGCY